MTTQNQAAEAIYARVVAQFTGTPFHFENEKFTNPQTAWVRFSIRTETRAQETLGAAGGRRFETRARLFAQVFTPLENGRQQGDTIGRQILNLFEAVSFSGLDFTNGNVREVGVDSGWFNHLVDVAFAYYETK